MSIATMVPIERAAEERGARIEQIRALAALGALQAVKNLNGGILVSMDDLRRLEWLPDVDTLSGKPIHVSEASRKYDLRTGSLSRWAQAGHIDIVGHEGNRTLLDEADVVCIRMVIDTAGLRKGQSLKSVLERFTR